MAGILPQGKDLSCETDGDLCLLLVLLRLWFFHPDQAVFGSFSLCCLQAALTWDMLTVHQAETLGNQMAEEKQV